MRKHFQIPASRSAAAVLLTALAGCVETTEMARRGDPGSGGIWTSSGYETQAAMATLTESSVTVKITIVALVMALLVAIIIGTSLYYKVQRQQSE